MGKFARDKGARGEVEVINLLQPIVDKAYADANPHVLDIRVITPQLKRTSSMQADGGGCDVHGLPWLALEVKRCETLQLRAWWAQAVAQARDGQTPILAYRQSRSEWRVRMWGLLGDGVVIKCAVEVSWAAFAVYFRQRLRIELCKLEPIKAR